MEMDKLLEDMMSSGAWTVILLVLSFIRIPKLELNIWGIIGKSLTKDISGKIDEVEKSVKEVDNKLDDHIKSELEREATASRQRILRFNDEIITGRDHSREHYNDMIEQIDIYEQYCLNHPDYKNNKCGLAIANIKEKYKSKCSSGEWFC